MTGCITFGKRDYHEGRSHVKNVYEGHSHFTGRPALKGLVFVQKRGNVKIPLEIIRSEFKEITNKKCDKKKSARSTTDLGNCLCKIIQLELQWRVLRVTGKS